MHIDVDTGAGSIRSDDGTMTVAAAAVVGPIVTVYLAVMALTLSSNSSRAASDCRRFGRDVPKCSSTVTMRPPLLYDDAMTFRSFHP